MVKIVMSRLALSLFSFPSKVVLKGPIYRRFLGEKTKSSPLFNQRDQIPLMMAWLCMLLGFGFQENNSLAPQ